MDGRSSLAIDKISSSSTLVAEAPSGSPSQTLSRDSGGGDIPQWPGDAAQADDAMPDWSSSLKLSAPPGYSADKEVLRPPGIPSQFPISSSPVNLGPMDSGEGKLARFAARFRYNAYAFNKKRVAGGWRTAPYIFVSEVAERLGSCAILFGLTVYLLTELNLPLVMTAKIGNAFSGASYLSPILGAFFADAYVGRFTVIVLGSIFYLAGLLVFTVSATASSLRPPEGTEASTYQLGILYLSLLLQAIGSGGVRPCVAPFGADQFDEANPKQKKQIQHFFNWYYTLMMGAMMISITVIIWIQTNYGWGWGSGISSATMGLSIVVFLMGCPFYRYMTIIGSPLTSVAQVFVATFHKRKLSLPESPVLLHQVKSLVVDQETLCHTDSLKFLDKAAIIDEAVDAGVESRGPWRLCTVQQVEELKLLIRMTPVWACSVPFSIVFAQGYTLAIKQSLTMDRRMTKHFEIPAPSIGFFNFVTLVIFIPIYDLCLINLFRKWTGNPKGLSYFQRLGVGYFISMVTMVVGAFIEMKRRNTAVDSGMVDMHHNEHLPISIFWLVPQYALAGIAESFIMPGFLEFFYEEGPMKMRSMSNAFLWASLGVGGFLSTGLYAIVQGATNDGWLQDNINRGHLDYFYFLLAIISMLTWVVFIFVARFYVYKNKDVQLSETAEVVASERIDVGGPNSL